MKIKTLAGTSTQLAWKLIGWSPNAEAHWNPLGIYAFHNMSAAQVRSWSCAQHVHLCADDVDCVCWSCRMCVLIMLNVCADHERHVCADHVTRVCWSCFACVLIMSRVCADYCLNARHTFGNISFLHAIREHSRTGVCWLCAQRVHVCADYVVQCVWCPTYFWHQSISPCNSWTFTNWCVLIMCSTC